MLSVKIFIFEKQKTHCIVFRNAELEKESNTIDFENRKIEISYEFFLTMVDGKIVLFLTDASSAQKCTICKTNPTGMNKLQNFDNGPINEEALQYGISSLHAYIT